MAKIVRRDKVLIIAGKDRLKTGTVEKVLAKENRLIVSGVNMVKKHLKRSGKNPQGGIIDKPSSIHISNVMLLDPKTDKPTRVGYQYQAEKKLRVSKRTKEPIIPGDQK